MENHTARALNTSLWIAKIIGRVQTRPPETSRMDRILQLKFAAAVLNRGMIDGTCPAPLGH